MVIVIKEAYRDLLARILKKETSLTRVETSGRIVLSKLSKPFEYKNRAVKSREIEKIEFIEEGDGFSVDLPDEGYSPGEIDFHTHIIEPKEDLSKDFHITVADIRAIVNSAAWFDPDSAISLPTSRFRVHCIISIMVEKSLLRKQGRAVLSFYIMDLADQNAQKGHPPYGLKRVTETVYVDF